MSPLRFFGSFVAGRLSSARRLIHQSRNLAGVVRGSGFSSSFPMGGNKLPASVVTVGTLSSALAGATLYLKKDTEQPTASPWELSNKNATTLEEVIAEEQDLVKEATMKVKFEEWMVKYGRRYKSEEEKAMRYREFKRHCKNAERLEFKRHCKNAERANMLCRGSTTFGPNHLADSTDEEWQCRKGSERDPTFAHRLGYPYRRALELWVLGK